MIDEDPRAIRVLSKEDELLMQRFYSLCAWSRHARDLWLKGEDIENALDHLDETRAKIKEMTGK